MTEVSDKLVQITGQLLVFCLVFGMSATVDTRCFSAQIKNAKAIMTGVILQFLLMPFLGFLLVRSLNLDHVTGIMLLIVCCSPGGSYSNWWCSMFNADLALSVTMTTVCTVLSVLFLPFNLMVYSHLTYEDDIMKQIQWGALFFSILIVIVAIGLGFYASHHYHSHEFNHNANRLGNFSGVLLVIFSLIMSNSNSQYQLWDRDWTFYFGVAAPCVLGLVIATAVSTGLWLLKPERVTVSIECCYQNVGIAMSIAAAIFDGDELAEAIGVPVYYGFVESVFVSLYCVWAWKAGWTKAPTDVSLWKAIATSYEVLALDDADMNGDGIQLPTTTDKSQRTVGEEWNYVNHEDAQQNANTTTAEPEKKEGGSWFGFM